MKLTINELLDKLNNTIDELKKSKILVIGDIILDRWLKGVVDRISPEAPVPVLRVEKEWNDLGGAANVAKILSYYSKNVSLLGIIGKDHFSTRIKRLLKRYRINDLTITYDKTIVKTRLIASNNQQIARVDREKENFKIPSKIIKDKLLSIPKKFDSVFIIDYNKGIFTNENLDLIMESLNNNQFCVSIKPLNFGCFSKFLENQNVNLLSLNKQEFQQITKNMGSENDIFYNMFEFIKKYKINKLLVTMGKDGLVVLDKSNFIKIDGIEVEVFDVTGAGDNVISVFGILNSIGFETLESGLLANIAGSICVSKPGTIAVKLTDLINYLMKIQKVNQKLPKFILTEV
ncbi:MAG: PfkB family carbohydrate kinase [Candidatus Calescibacterium sp.]|nr:PfkB family carbohydrate kinase [Candidatus Calescibacterium sp.]MDW8132084.1 PfkB family carbohydrate kinase [Candidatus Calescibacterium sp.]